MFLFLKKVAQMKCLVLLKLQKSMILSNISCFLLLILLLIFYCLTHPGHPKCSREIKFLNTFWGDILRAINPSQKLSSPNYHQKHKNNYKGLTIQYILER